MGLPSSIEALSKSSISLSSKSYTMCSRISLSAMKPMALKTTISGISFLM